MASAFSRSLKRWGAVASAFPPTLHMTRATRRNLSASIPRFNHHKPPQPASSQQPSSSDASQNNSALSAETHHPNNDGAFATSSGYQPPSKSSGTWPFDSSSSESSSETSSETSSPPSTSNPYAGLLDGEDAFPKTSQYKLAGRSSPQPSSESDAGSWLSDKLDSLTSSPRTPRNIGRSFVPNPNQNPDGRKRHPIPRSVLFADAEIARQSDDFRPRKPSPSSQRRRFNRTPLTQQEANAFMSLLNQALAGNPSSPSSSTPGSTLEASKHTPFGSYTSLINNPKTQSGSKALLQAFAKRNRLNRFEEARAQRAKRFVREGLAAQIDPLQLEAGIDEAREQISNCENLSELMDWAKKEVWGIGPAITNAALDALAESLSEASLGNDEPSKARTEKVGPRYGKNTPYYAAVLQLLFLAIRDRYHAPHVALSVVKVTRSLGIESYVTGVTGSLYNEMLKTQWDWLGDLQGIVQTLGQARETGILSESIKTSGDLASASNVGAKSTLAMSEDEAIRETVDRIANEVRKYVLDQQMVSRPAFKRSYLYGDGKTGNFGLAGNSAQVRTERMERSDGDWSQKWLLANAEEASGLAGQPFRLLHEGGATRSNAGGSARVGGKYNGSTVRRVGRSSKDGMHHAKDFKSYRNSSFGHKSRSPKSRSFDM